MMYEDLMKKFDDLECACKACLETAQETEKILLKLADSYENKLKEIVGEKNQTYK